MSVTYGFYDSLNGDRIYNARQVSSLFDGFIADGVFITVGNRFMVNAINEMAVTVGTGRAWFNHTWTLNDAILRLDIEESGVVLDRIDAVVLEVNEDINERTNSIKIIKGTSAASPVRPTLVNNDSLHQYPLAYIYVPANATRIIEANITNMVGTSETPFVTAISETTFDIDGLISQWASQWDNWTRFQKADFLAWFAELDAVLDHDTAAFLAARILSAESSFAPVEDDYVATRPYAAGDYLYLNHDVSDALPRGLYKTNTAIPEGGYIYEAREYALANNPSATIKGITFTVNQDGSITINGTLTESGKVTFEYFTGNESVEVDDYYTFEGIEDAPSLDMSLTLLYRRDEHDTSDRSSVLNYAKYKDVIAVDVEGGLLKSGTIVLNAYNGMYVGDEIDNITIKPRVTWLSPNIKVRKVTIGSELLRVQNEANSSIIQINEKLPFPLGIDEQGRYGYVKEGADTVTPFRNPTGNAIASQVLSGLIFSNALGDDLVGTMPNIGAVSINIAPGGSYAIPEGYHNGSGKVNANKVGFSYVTRGANRNTSWVTWNYTVAANSQLLFVVWNDAMDKAWASSNYFGLSGFVSTYELTLMQTSAVWAKVIYGYNTAYNFSGSLWRDTNFCLFKLS